MKSPSNAEARNIRARIDALIDLGYRYSEAAQIVSQHKVLATQLRRLVGKPLASPSQQ